MTAGSDAGIETSTRESNRLTPVAPEAAKIIGFWRVAQGEHGDVGLSTISRRPTYGYEIIRELERSSQDFFVLGEGTVYPLLRKLESEKLLDGHWSEESGQRRRRYYQLSRAGEVALEQRRKQWKSFRDAVDRVIEEGS